MSQVPTCTYLLDFGLVICGYRCMLALSDHGGCYQQERADNYPSVCVHFNIKSVATVKPLTTTYLVELLLCQLHSQLMSGMIYPASSKSLFFCPPLPVSFLGLAPLLNIFFCVDVIIGCSFGNTFILYHTGHILSLGLSWFFLLVFHGIPRIFYLDNFGFNKFTFKVVFYLDNFKILL